MSASAAGFHQHIAPHVRGELESARQARAAGRHDDAFRHLERAHVLGQASTRWHVLVHLNMLVWAMDNRRPREVVGQLLRAVGALTKTAFGWVPVGNTGGANVSPFQPMPVDPELEVIIAAARRGEGGAG